MTLAKQQKSIFTDLFRGPCKGFIYSSLRSLHKDRELNLKVCQTRSSEPHGLKILYFGSDDFSIGALEYLHDLYRQSRNNNQKIKCLDVVYSVSQSKSRGRTVTRYPKIESFVSQHGLQSINWCEIGTKLASIPERYDFGVVSSFGHLIPMDVMQHFNRGMVNIHPSLLPRWRGSAPIEHTILNGENKTGISIIELSVGKFDHGKILLTKTFPVPRDATLLSLTTMLSKASGPMVWEVMQNFPHYREHAVEQSRYGGTYAPKIKKNIGKVKWSEDTVDYIDRLYRAVGSRVGLYTSWRGKRVKLLEINGGTVDSETSVLRYGSYSFDKDTAEVIIKCKDGFIRVGKFQMEFGVPVCAKHFYETHLQGASNEGAALDLFI